MTVFISQSYEAAIVFSQDDFCKFQEMVSELYDAEARDERGLIDAEFLARLYASLEGLRRPKSEAGA
jgi:hypothetical protein